VTALVVDASVAAKWFPPLDRESLATEARVLLDRWIRGEIELIAPDFLWVELANILWKSVRQNRSSPSDAKAALALLHQQNLRTIPAEPLIDRAFGIAVEYGRTVYDSMYVALAIASNSELVTADEKLANALAAHLPVKWLGAL
jgi:predicted nucleic acid-binding protein